jgi:hypothetical protein
MVCGIGFSVIAGNPGNVAAQAALSTHSRVEEPDARRPLDPSITFTAPDLLHHDVIVSM